MTFSRPTIGIAFPEPVGERTWSGIPAGLTKGLEELGVQVVHLTGTSTGGTAARSREVADRTSEEILQAVEAADGLDGVVQMGSTFSLPDGVRYVTFEDVTVAQALAVLPVSSSWARQWRQRQHHAYRRAVACCVASAWAGRSVCEDYEVPAEKVHVVGFGANVEVEAPAEKAFDAPRFLFVGRDWQRKNGPAVLRTFAAVRRRFPAATLDLVGEHPEVADAPGVRGHGPLDRSTAAGRRALASLLRNATCLVLPSRFEPFGIAYVEAGAAGVPSIGTVVGGAADAVGAGGLLVDPTDQRALRDAMLELCSPVTARRLGLLARRNAARYSWKLVAERVLAAFRAG